MCKESCSRGENTSLCGRIGYRKKSSSRTRRTKLIGKLIKVTFEVGCYKESCINLGDGFSSGSKSETESVPEVEEVTAEFTENYWKKKHVAISSMLKGTKICCIYCKDVFTLSTAVAHLHNQCKE